MRTEKDICLLCCTNFATKKNSHILPKFFNKVIRNNNAKKHAILYKTISSYEFRQDTPKENYLFCPDCENRFSVLETYVSQKLNIINKASEAIYLPTYNINGNKYFILNDLEQTYFALFIYSLLWRMHHSEDVLFKPFKLNDNIADSIRDLLDNNLHSTKTDLLANLPSFQIPYPFIFLKPENIMRSSWLIYFHHTNERRLWQIAAMSYMIFFTEEIDLIPPQFYPSTNYQNNTSRISIISNQDWKRLMKIMIDNFNSTNPK